MSDPVVIPTTYQQDALNALAGMGDAVNLALAAAGLAPLVTWSVGVRSPRQTGTPYAWVEREDSDNAGDVEKSGRVSFTLDFSVAIVLAGANSAVLEEAIAAYGPVIQAAVETAGCAPYRLRTETARPVAKEHGNEHLAIVAIPIQISGDRTRRSVN